MSLQTADSKDIDDVDHQDNTNIKVDGDDKHKNKKDHDNDDENEEEGQEAMWVEEEVTATVPVSAHLEIDAGMMKQKIGAVLHQSGCYCHNQPVDTVQSHRQS